MAGPNATEEEIVAAAKLANAHDFITEMPHGYDTMVGDRGLTLSGGQRQRIGIARAVIRDTPILILDEPTAALDTESERLVIEGLERLMKGRTVITIAHRLSTIRDAHKIIVLKDGVVHEQGTHDELLKLNGVYAELHHIQFDAPAAARSRLNAPPDPTAQSGNPSRHVPFPGSAARRLRQAPRGRHQRGEADAADPDVPVHRPDDAADGAGCEKARRRMFA